MRSLNTDLKDITNKYIQNTSNKAKNNLSRNQAKGLKGLTDKVSSGDIVVFQTDKSGRFAVDTTENYKNAGSCHVEGDGIITIKEHQKIKDLTNAHARSWVRMGRHTAKRPNTHTDRTHIHTPDKPRYQTHSQTEHTEISD